MPGTRCLRSRTRRRAPIRGSARRPRGAAPAPADPHAGHAMPAEEPPLPPFIPPLTDEDRQAAFPQVAGHTIHDDVTSFFVLFDQIEGRAGQGDEGGSWDVSGWVGKDRDRLWFRTEGVRTADGDFDDVQTHALLRPRSSRAGGTW